MTDLEIEHAHNNNLVRQFEELSTNFKAWRPVRGDGNCYYRAVIFAWLERLVGLGRYKELRNYASVIKSLKENPILRVSAKICLRNLKLRNYASVIKSLKENPILRVSA